MKKNYHKTRPRPLNYGWAMKNRKSTDQSQYSSNLNTSSTSRLKYAAIRSINSADGAPSTTFHSADSFCAAL